MHIVHDCHGLLTGPSKPPPSLFCRRRSSASGAIKLATFFIAPLHAIIEEAINLTENKTEFLEESPLEDVRS